MEMNQAEFGIIEDIGEAQAYSQLNGMFGIKNEM